jgi:hypothetical protein
MTAQASDSLRYADEFYSITGISPDRGIDELFRPSSLDIKTSPCSSACWRGYIATYALLGDQLVLEELRINIVSKKWEEEHMRLLALKEVRRMTPPHRRGPKAQASKDALEDEGPPINGVPPLPGRYCNSRFSDNYFEVGLPLPFSGGLMISRDFVREHYVHMGFQASWKYEKVFELRFREGVLAATYDRSADMAAIRKANAGRNPDALGKPVTPRGIADWIGRRFDQSY